MIIRPVLFAYHVAPEHRMLTRVLLISSVLGVVGFMPAVHGQDDWEAAEQEALNRPAGDVQQGFFELSEETFDQWLYGNMDARQAKKRIEALLTLQIESVERVCTLSDTQRKKLQLAGYGDVKRFDDETEKVRIRFRALRRDQNKINEIWEHIQPLQAKFYGGLFHDKSLFHKVLARTLDAQQSAQYEQQELERRRFRYEAQIGLAINTIENGVPLQDEQRQELTRLLLEETKPPASYGQYGFYIVLYNLARIPEEKLKPIFDGAQWRAMTQLFDQAKRMEAFLKRGAHVQ